MINTHMLVGEAFERMGIEKAPRNVSAKPLLSLMLETIGHLPKEDESFRWGDLEITAKTVLDGRVTEAIVHILDEEDLAATASSEEREEVQA